VSAAVRAGIYSKLTGDATLIAFLSGSTAVYHAVAPDTATYPLVIFQKQASTPRYTHRQRAWDEELWTIKGVTRADSAVADNIASRLDALLTDGTLTITGKTFMSLRRESDVEYPDVDGDQIYRHAGATYRLRYQG